MIFNLLVGTICFGLFQYVPADTFHPLPVDITNNAIELEINGVANLSYKYDLTLNFNFTTEYTSVFTVPIRIHEAGSVYIDSYINNEMQLLAYLQEFEIQLTNIDIYFNDDYDVYKPFIEFDFKLGLYGISNDYLVDKHLQFSFTDVDNLFTYGRLDNFQCDDIRLIFYASDYYNIYNAGVSSTKLTNNVFAWFGEIVDSFTNFLSLEIAPGLNLGLIISVPIITGVLFFLLKALIN